MLIATVLVGCSRAPQPVQLAGSTMGTSWHVTYIETAQVPDAQVVSGGIEEVLAGVNASMSTYLDDSEISSINAEPADKWVDVSPDFLAVLETALIVGRASEGAYDTTIAPLVDLWGFGAAGDIAAPPDPLDIEKTMVRIGQDKLEIDREQSRIVKRADLSLDFSSLAKGYAVDRVADWLLAQGIERFMVEVGGEMRLSGLSGRDDPWRIAIEQPDTAGRSMAAAISLTDVAIATSGDYRNFFEAGGRRYSHMLDPRTGWPVAHDLVSVTVVHPGCMQADAWATALAVLGAERGMAVAQAQGLAVYFIRRTGEGFAHSHTPAFSRYLVEPGALEGS